MAKKNEFQEKIKIIEKLAILGIKSEKDIEELKPRDLLVIENISFEEIDLISQIKLCVQGNTLKSFGSLSKAWKKEKRILHFCIGLPGLNIADGMRLCVFAASGILTTLTDTECLTTTFTVLTTTNS